MNKSLLSHRMFALSICLLLVLNGCGIYSFTGSSIPSHIKNVMIPLFDDQTSEFGIDQRMTDGLIDAITKDNTLKIAGLKNADSILRGTILRVDDRAGQYDSNETASDFQIFLTVKVVFEDVTKREILWEETWTRWGRYDNGDISRDEGINEAVEKITTDILNQMVSGW